MDETGIILYLIVNGIRSVLAVRLLSVFLTKKQNQGVLIAVTILYWGINSIGYLCANNEWMNLVTNILGLLLISCVGYTDKIWNKVLITALGIATGVIAESLAYAIYVKDESTIQVMSINVLSVFLYLILTMVLDRTVSFYKDRQVPLWNHVLLLIIVIGLFYVGYVIVDFVGGAYTEKKIALGILLLTCVSIYYLYDGLIKTFVRMKENEIYEMQSVMYKGQLDVMKQANEANRILRHDMKHHLIMLSGYIRKEESEKALEYIQNISKIAEVGDTYIRTGNETIDSIVNYYDREFMKTGIRLKKEINVTEEIHIKDHDISVILSNLLENMLEATVAAQEEEAALRIQYDRNLIRIMTENGYSGDLIKEEGGLGTTKKDKNRHGLGMKSIKKTVEKYEGEMKIGTENGRIKIEIWMYDT